MTCLQNASCGEVPIKHLAHVQLPADGALEGLFAGMDAHVPIQSVLFGEAWVKENEKEENNDTALNERQEGKKKKKTT